MYVFVYGTLKQGLSNHRLLEGAKLIGKASTVESFILIDFGPYPTLINSTPALGYPIQGELYEVENLKRLDGLEGYYGENNVNNLYNRDQHQIECNGGQITAWMYMINRKLSGRYKYVPNGVWPSESREIFL